MTCHDRRLVLFSCFEHNVRYSVQKFDECIGRVTCEIAPVKSALCDSCKLFFRCIAEYAGCSCMCILNIRACLSVEVQDLVP